MPSSDLQEWNFHWRLVAGIVSCRKCLAHQSEELRNALLVHTDTCPYRLSKRTPWDELGRALHNIGVSDH